MTDIKRDTKTYIKMPNGKLIVNVKKIDFFSEWITVWADNGKSYSTHPSNVVVIDTQV